MKRSQIYMLAGCLVLGLGILFTLYASSPISKEIPRAGFNREFTLDPPVQKKVMDIEFNSFYIAGQTDDTLYLGNSTAPFHLLIANRQLTDSQHVMLRVRLDSITEPQKFRLTVDPPYFFLSNGVMPKQLRGKLGEWVAEDLLGDSTPYFAESVSLGNSSFALRAYSRSQNGYELARSSVANPFQYNYDLLQKQLDGMFCVDGQLLYNKKLARLVYLHYYRNEFLVADSNLNLIYRGHTIDTFSRARIELSKTRLNKSMMSVPPVQVNGLSCVSEKYLFVQSNLLANNEDIQNYMTKSVIDIYDLVTGAYFGSFYIPKYKGEKLMDFKVQGNHLIVISDHYLVTYELTSKTLTP